jgi:hypothetical protein
MKTHRTLPITLLLCAAFAACERLPTDSAAAPGQASYDTGLTIGSGNKESGGNGDGAGAGAGDTSAAGTMDGGTTQTDSTGRGGFGVGSGN